MKRPTILLRSNAAEAHFLFFVVTAICSATHSIANNNQQTKRQVLFHRALNHKKLMQSHAIRFIVHTLSSQTEYYKHVERHSGLRERLVAKCANNTQFLSRKPSLIV